MKFNLFQIFIEIKIIIVKIFVRKDCIYEYNFLKINYKGLIKGIIIV